jgi:hypothetical protein
MLPRARFTHARTRPPRRALPQGRAAARTQSPPPRTTTRPAAGIPARAATSAAAAALALAAAVTPAQATTRPAQPTRQPAQAIASGLAGPRPAARLRAACPRARPGQVRCLALYAPQVAVNKAIAAGARGPAAQPQGWGAPAIESAYTLPVSLNPHQTVAVADAFSTPHLAADLATYRHHYGLPPCTTGTGCLRIVNQDGNTSPLPAPDPLNWGVEETLDVAMVSAACPHCKILVVEARSASFADLATAENTAARLGAQVISNSYGAQESGFSQAYASAYHHPGHTIVVASGDSGFTAASFPANLATVTAAGGTQLARARNPRGWAETVWNAGEGVASGSGCSAYVPKPGWQHDTHCPGRTTADVAALASNIPIYDTSLRPYGGPWVTVGGTSASSPLIAGVYALAGNAATVKPGYPYHHQGHLFDITTGTNASSGTPAQACGNDYLCTAKPGYDAPTGLGTPNGTSSF